MFESSVFRSHDRGTAEEKLWRAVIAKTLEEWIRGPLSYSRKAEHYLFNDNKDFQAVCSSAGMDAGYLRKRLRALRARGIQRENSQLQPRGQKKSDPQLHGVFAQKAFGV